MGRFPQTFGVAVAANMTCSTADRIPDCYSLAPSAWLCCQEASSSRHRCDPSLAQSSLILMQRWSSTSGGGARLFTEKMRGNQQTVRINYPERLG
ncbi:hypothetical protein OPV22_016479 [Ensete ventricosum]|uniref:Secreted protein n=1 Tax=Ensete ventricosum TaxID=4639 RepID=A0AAV8QVL2_ENSVE|nr:hypothetical protein OPV22_016479 [Ensete ventricosum]